jgi:DedD protein
MEEKNDLMGNIANDGNNMKKYLIIAGLVFVIFVIGIVIAKFAFGTSKNNTQVILPPEPTTKAQKSDTELFNSIPVEKADTTDNTQKIVKKVLQVKKPESNVTEFKKPKPIEPVVEKAKVVEPKKIVKTKPKSIQTKTTLSKKIVKNYYIQVAAVTRGEPSKKFLKLIKQNGFDYKIVEVDIKGKKIKRVLVGPFTQKEVQQELSKVKAKITASAFIKKLK